MTAHLCLGVGGCCDCDPQELVIIEMTLTDMTPEDALRRMRTVLDELPGVETDRPIEAQQSLLNDDVTVRAVVRITDRKRVPEEQHPDPEDGPSIPGGILDSVMEQLGNGSFAAGSAGWLVRE